MNKSRNDIRNIHVSSSLIHNVYLFLFVFYFSTLNAQDSLKVRINPPNQFTWSILYQLKDIKQNYINNKQINQDSLFSYDLTGKEPGVYLLMYDMNPKNFVYFIYNNEPVSLEVFPFENNQINVLASKENKLYIPFDKKQKKLNSSLQKIEEKLFNNTISQTDKELFIQLKKKYDSLHAVYESKSKNLLAENLIKNSRTYYPDSIYPLEKYLELKELHFFDYLDFYDKDVQHSNIIIDKINDYVFNFNMPKKAEDKHLKYLKKIERVLKLIKDENYRNNIILSLTLSFVDVDGRVTKLLIEKYIKKMSEEIQNQIDLDKLLDKIGLTIGEKAPNFTFQDAKGQKYSLYEITSSKPYTLLVFWSSTCSHCLTSLPKVSQLIENQPDLKAIAIGLENEKYTWSAEHLNYPGFIHGFKLQKWNNPVAKTYHIKSTPTYFILNNKNIIVDISYKVKDIQAFFKRHLKRNN